MNHEKILQTHLDRKVVVYARQSTLRQLHDHKESTLRQYALKTRAMDCGWREDQIVCIDEDLGQSGASGDWRQGFQRLAEDVAHGRVGGIFSLEVSRLARSSADWHKLLELCVLTDVLIPLVLEGFFEKEVFNAQTIDDVRTLYSFPEISSFTTLHR